MNKGNELYQSILAHANDLLPETHPQVCALRDENPSQLQEQVVQIIQDSPQPISVQTALAQLEAELAEANGEA